MWLQHPCPSGASDIACEYVNLKEGRDALHRAAKDGHEEVVKTLLDAGADVGLVDEVFRSSADRSSGSRCVEAGCVSYVGLVWHRTVGRRYCRQHMEGSPQRCLP